MNKFSAWALVIYAVAVTGFAGYEYGYIIWLEKMAAVLMSGSPN